MSYPTLFTTPSVRQFAAETDAERQRQTDKFGDAEAQRDARDMFGEWAQSQLTEPHGRTSPSAARVTTADGSPLSMGAVASTRVACTRHERLTCVSGE
ncbi:hypothetical protein ABZ922_34605 [Streptomyces shenzhenensis]|uniref:hypothetical protein n=1 Tax=Streptomyces shenzhenensis TaxID=943815 RepID=UPI0033FD2ADA